ncbi:hypothetical protein KSC_002580 [Ktedonobacter sp. SOSP1-52]|uniref:hypothetical protein n=1 Tax=Ktedonobacter sp. SOSP1-52 TaxID=2778366 RepID=UPI00191546B1|nr:hypothetical protein [Ktedonobacter sp. SOSP1-52]GHO61366.1 hypothetical protein KSC_002580 [Ktedonobacter sp. SOSP1-52]
MSALQNPLSSLYKEICSRYEYLRRFARIEYDDEEYQQLLSCARDTLKYYNRIGITQQKEARAALLAFACEYVRRNKPTDDNVFWKNFSSEIGIPDGIDYSLAADLLWQSYEEYNIPQLRGSQNRLIVKSLISEVQASEVNLEDCIEFFYWYYYQVGHEEITSEMLLQYERSTKRVLNLHPKALPGFSRDCQLLSRIVEYTTENGLSFFSTNRDSYSQQIRESLGEEYDFAKIHFVRNAAQLGKIFARLENYVTPALFLKIIAQGSLHAHVRAPRSGTVAAYVACKHWQAQTLSYGLYSLDQTMYRVVPQPWVSLAAIAQWPSGQIVPLRKGFVGYKRSVRFTAKSGSRTSESRECILETGKVCYIWVGGVPKGEPLWIDGKLCQASEGVSWEIALAMGETEEGPTLLLRCDALKVFFPTKPRAPLAITTSQNHTWEGFLSSEGYLKKSRSIVFPLQPGCQSLSLTLSLDGQPLSQKLVQLQPAYLFSARTFEHIPMGVRDEGEERAYYLFAPVGDRLSYDERCLEVELLEHSWGDFAIYRIIWDEGPFRLQLGSCVWAFLRRSYFFAQMIPNTHREPFRFSQKQIQRFSEASLRIFTDIDVGEASIECQVFSREQCIFQTDFCSHLNRSETEPHSYTARLQLFEDLDRVVGELLGEERYGHYEFFFYRDERLLDTATLTLLPPLKVSTDINQLVWEQKPLPLTVSTSPSLLLWNTAQNRLHTTTTLFIYPSMKRTIAQLDAQYPGLFGFSSEEVTTSIVFPSIGAFVEIAVRPVVFGVRLYQRQQVGRRVTDYKCVETGDYYSLQQTVVYVFTRPGALVSLFQEGKCLQQRRADSNGNFLLTELNAVQQECKSESTRFEVSSEGQTASFTIRWVPVVYTCHVEDGQVVVDMDGPLGSSVIVDIVDTDRTVLASFPLSCRGERYVTSFALPLLKGVASQGYIIPRYVLADGTLISGIKQWRIPLNPKTLTIPDTWLQAGVGFSSDELFTSLVLDI